MEVEIIYKTEWIRTRN